MNLNDFQGKCINAASKYLQRRGYEVTDTHQDEAGNTFLFAIDDDVLVVAAVTGSRDAEKLAEKPSQEAFEGAMLVKLSDCDITDCPVRPDHVTVHAIGDDRALLRHHVGCFGGFLSGAPEVDL